MARRPSDATKIAMLAERQRRQRLSAPLRAEGDYPELVRRLQPISTGPYARPGSPPCLQGRTRFDDLAAADRLRVERTLVKGRFLGGGVGYVLAEDLELYANAFWKPLPRPSAVQAKVLAALEATGPLTPQQLREETGLLSKQIMPALHRLQTAFLVYEDQVDGDWDRAWSVFSSEWPELEIRETRRDAALCEVALRFVQAMVFATPEQLRDWTRLAVGTLKRALSTLEAGGRLVPLGIPGLGDGLCAPEDVRLAERSPKTGVQVLNKADFLVRAHASELARRFAAPDLLQYLLIDGELRGAICGRWGFKPYDVQDVALDLPASACKQRCDEILKQVVDAYPQPRHNVLRYAGRKL